MCMTEHVSPSDDHKKSRLNPDGVPTDAALLMIAEWIMCSSDDDDEAVYVLIDRTWPSFHRVYRTPDERRRLSRAEKMYLKRDTRVDPSKVPERFSLSNLLID